MLYEVITLAAQHRAFKKILDHDFSDLAALPRMVMPVAITGKGIAREGYRVFCNGKHVGFITSGTSVPYRLSSGSGLDGRFESKIRKRPIALALLDANIQETDELVIEIRKKMCSAVVVTCHMSSQAPPYVRAIVHDQIRVHKDLGEVDTTQQQAHTLLKKALHNHKWRNNFV